MLYNVRFFIFITEKILDYNVKTKEFILQQLDFFSKKSRKKIADVENFPDKVLSCVLFCENIIKLLTKTNRHV